MIGQIVAVRHAAEHAAHPGAASRSLRAPCGCRRPSCQRRADGFEHQLSSTPETTSTSPMRTGSTKWILPWMVFLSCTRRARRFAARNAIERRNRAVAPDSFEISTPSSAERWPVVSPGRRPRACPRRPLRRGGSACSRSRLRAHGRRCGRNSGCGADRLRARRRRPLRPSCGRNRR